MRSGFMMPRIFKNTNVCLIIIILIITGLLSSESHAFLDNDTTSVRIITEKSFLAYNLHADRGRGKLSSVNYQIMGTLIKWGTPVKIIEIYSKYDSDFTSEFILIDLSENIEHRFIFHGRTLKYQKPDQYFGAITTEDYNALKTKTERLPQIDRTGIDKGIVMEGMSKEGVLIALGLPPIFSNPSPDRSNIWHYWFKKKSQFKVSFNKEAKVNEISGNYPYRQQYVPLTEKEDDLVIKEKQDDDGIKAKLESLKKLYEEELITKEDYESKKAEILSEL